MLCLMHESDERGVLLLAGKPMPLEALSRILRIDEILLNQILGTLLTYGVASRREEDGAIYNRRMVRDEKLIQTRRNAGKMGGNPALLNQKDNQKPTTGVKQNPTPSSSSSSSEVDKREREKGEPEKGNEPPKSPHRRPTLAQAKSAAADIGITPAKAEEWWNAREASEWVKGMAGGGTSPVGSNWQADLTTYSKRGGFNPQSSKPSHRQPSAYEADNNLTLP